MTLHLQLCCLKSSSLFWTTCMKFSFADVSWLWDFRQLGIFTESQASLPKLHNSVSNGIARTPLPHLHGFSRSQKLQRKIKCHLGFHLSCFPSQYCMHNTSKFYSHLGRDNHTCEPLFQQICVLLFSRSRKFFRWFSFRTWKPLCLVYFPEDTIPIVPVQGGKPLLGDYLSCNIMHSNTHFLCNPTTHSI